MGSALLGVMKMDGIITGVCVGAVMILINAVVGGIAGSRKKSKKEAQKTADNEQKIEMLEKSSKETKELVRLTLGTCIIIGDGMVQNGNNGDFKKAFCDKKQDALKML